MLERHLRTRMSYLVSIVLVTASYRSSMVLGATPPATSSSAAGPGGGGYLPALLWTRGGVETSRALAAGWTGFLGSGFSPVIASLIGLSKSHNVSTRLLR